MKQKILQTPIFIQAESDLSKEGSNIVHVLNQQSTSVLLDFSVVTTMNTSTILLMLKAQQILAKKGLGLALINPSSAVRTWLYITKLQRVIPTFPNLNIANRYIQELSNANNSSKNV